MYSNYLRNSTFLFIYFIYFQTTANYLSALNKNFQVKSANASNIGYQICDFCYDLFLKYSENRYTQKPTAKKHDFRIEGTPKRVNQSTSPFLKK